MSKQTTQEPKEVPDRAEDGSPTNKSSTTANLWAKPMPERAYDLGEEVFASARGRDGKMRRVKAKVQDYQENNRKWEYLLSSPPADQRWYKESELE